MTIRGHARAIFRLFLAAVATIVLLVLWGTGRILSIGSRRRAMRVRGWITQQWSRSLARIMGMRVIVVGEPPEPPFCLVANHLSYIDVILLASIVKGVFVSRADVAGWPIIGYLSRWAGTLFLERSRIRQIVAINERIEAVLDRGDGLIFFPEGTSSSGDGVTRFRSPLLNYPAMFSYPVHFAAIDYKSDSFDVRMHVCWWADMTFADHMYGLFAKPGFQARVRFGGEPVVESDRKRLATVLEERVRTLYDPVRNTPLP